MSKAYADALKAAMDELTELSHKKRDIDTRILRVRQTIATLARLTLGEQPEFLTNKGITDAIRDAMKVAAGSDHPDTTPKTVKEFLETIGYDFSNYKNPIASINGTLSKMADRGEVKRVRVRLTDGQKVGGYRWIGDAPTAGGEEK